MTKNTALGCTQASQLIVTKAIVIVVIYLVLPKAAAKLELKFLSSG
jgi:hypothetical protein